MLNRVVLKLSGEALAGEAGHGFDDTVTRNIAGEILSVISDCGTQFSLTVGGGNFWRGRNTGPAMDRSKSDQIGMLGTVMNAIYLSETFRELGRRAVVMTPFPVGTFTEVYRLERALAYLEQGTVVIHAGGLGHPYFSTDTITALRAAELSADGVLYAKNVDGVYDTDPRKNPSARKYRTISYQKVMADGLDAADVAAMTISQQAGTDSYLFALNLPRAIRAACRGDLDGMQGTRIAVAAKEDYYA